MQQAGGEEVGQRYVRVSEPFHMGDKSRSFDREQEVVWGLLGPGREAGRTLQAIMRAVHLDGAELPAGECQFLLPRQIGDVEAAAPRRVGPARDADADIRGTAHRWLPF